MSAAVGGDKEVSKKEQNRLAKKEKKTVEKPIDDGTPFVYTIALSRGQGPKADLTRAVELFLGSGVPKIRYTIATGTTPGLPTLTEDSNPSAGSLSGDANIAKFLAYSSPLYSATNSWLACQVDQWLELYTYTVLSPSYLATLPILLETHLESRTYLVGHSLSLADIAIVIALQRLDKSVTLGLNVQRWVNLITPTLPAITPPTFTFPPSSADKSKKEKVSAAGTSEKQAVIKEEDGGTCPPLENAEEGKVCTRFPPEPSGYLHIGHAKAVLLNQYYAQRYKGKLIVRFDDTNPSKEKEEFEENIMHDLLTLGVKADMVSHSSDYFPRCEQLARQMISAGLAYMDDTDQEEMQAQRMARQEGKHRNDSASESLKNFEAMLRGDVEGQKFCLRAKIDMQSVNGTMRDPVLYRYNPTPHHRTGTKYKAYPTYDFVCPIVDSLEGVTHALRTTEYNDRDEQYHWIQNALGLRYVYIQTFGKMNFVNTVLSKRKLTWFVEQKLVEGWFDPRFPTIQGCVRRGVNVHALKNFIISQGASRRVITMEWDKFWAENKKVLEDTSPRYMAVHTQDVVKLHISNVDGESVHSVQLHPQKPEMGNRVMRRNKVVYIDQIDAATFSVGEDITLLRWGNIRISHIERDAAGKVQSMTGEYDALATNFSKTKKATWLADNADVVKCVLVEFDHLISKAKLGDEEDFKDFVNPASRFPALALADPLLRTLQVGEVVQLERKGFYRVDKAFGGAQEEGGDMVLFFIPDGKTKPMTATKK